MKYKRSEIELQLEAIARCCCFVTYIRDHPGCTPFAAWSHSNRHWWSFVKRAIHIMSIVEAVEEAEAAPWN